MIEKELDEHYQDWAEDTPLEHLPDCMYGMGVPLGLCCLKEVAFKAGATHQPESATDCTEQVGQLKRLVRRMHAADPQAWQDALHYFDDEGWSIGTQFGTS